eukprot:COSAG06_NODE_365_length_16774_cov_42.676882_22_plen_182_part_00
MGIMCVYHACNCNDRLYSLTAAGWATVATLQARRAAGPVAAAAAAAAPGGPAAIRQNVVGGDGPAAGVGAAAAAAVPGPSVPVADSQPAAASAASAGGVLVDNTAALIDGTVSAALAHLPSQPVWPTEAADDPGWVSPAQPNPAQPRSAALHYLPTYSSPAPTPRCSLCDAMCTRVGLHAT